MSECNTALALRAVEELKKGHCKINLSELINEYLESTFSKSFEKEKKKFEKKFFDRKKYLKNLLKSDSGQNFDESLKKLVQKISTTKAKKIEHEAS